MENQSYRVKGLASDGESFWADGSETGKVFQEFLAADDYALAYAQTVGEVRVAQTTDPARVSDNAYEATKEDGYTELVYVVKTPYQEDTSAALELVSRANLDLQKALPLVEHLLDVAAAVRGAMNLSGRAVAQLS